MKGGERFAAVGLSTPEGKRRIVAFA